MIMTGKGRVRGVLDLLDSDEEDLANTHHTLMQEGVIDLMNDF
jgi:hypothetical protein